MKHSIFLSMASFGETFELCKIPDGTELIGIEKHSEEDHIILTFGNKEVLVYNVPDRRIVHSWSLEPKEKFSCPVVYEDELYHGIKDDKWLLTWEPSVPELWQSSMVKLRKPAKKINICTARSFQHDPVLIFEDNEAIPFNEAGKEKKKKSSNVKPDRLLWCGTHIADDNKVWFLKTLFSEDSSKLSLVMNLFKESKQLVFNVKKPDESTIISWSLVDEENETPFFLSLWSNGGIYKTEIPTVKTASEQELSCEHLFNVCEGPVQLSQFSPVHVCHVKLSFICVACSGAGNESQKDTLSLWDTKFKTMHCQKSLSLKSASSSSANVRHLQCTSNFIITANDSSVSVCSYTAEKSTLKSSLGVLQEGNNKKSQNIKPQFLTTPKLIEPNQSVEEWKSDVAKEDEAESEMLCCLLDSKKTKTAKKLAAELRKCLEKTSSSDSEKPGISQYCVTSIFERCTKEKQLWSSETGKLILKTGALPQRCFSQFFSLVLENNDMDLLQDSLLNLYGISESILVDCLKFVLSCDDDVFPVCENTEVWIQTDTPCSLSRAKYLSLVLSHPINDAFLQSSLRRLHFQETLLFMKFLLHVIKFWSMTLQDILQAKESKHNFCFAQVLDWAALTLNSHFTKLIFVPEAQTLLVNLHKVIAEQMATCENLNQLDGYLRHFKEHEPLPKNDRSSAYTIETMEL